MSTNARAQKKNEKSLPEQSLDADEATTIPIIDKNENRENADAPEPNGPETTDGPDAPQVEPQVDPVIEMEKKLAASDKEAKSAYDRFLRVSAEFDNYKKRILRETAESRKYANETLLKAILPVVDNLERALTAAKEGNTAANGLIDGVEITLKELLKVFEKFAVKSIDARGTPFDPMYHQAMGQEKTDKHPENTVIEEFQKGYTHHDRLLRPAMVIVAKPIAKDE